MNYKDNLTLCQGKDVGEWENLSRVALRKDKATRDVPLQEPILRREPNRIYLLTRRTGYL